MPDEGIVTPAGIVVPAEALSWRFTRAGGPGGQHVNTSDTRVELLCDLGAIDVGDEVRARLVEVLGPQVRIVAATNRSQWRNRRVALDRLASRLDHALRRPAQRRATRPSRRAVEERLGDKRHQSARKASRKPQTDD